MKTRASTLAIVGAAGLAAAANAQVLTPPNFSALAGNVPVYSPPYTQMVSGSGNVVGFQLIANGSATGGAWNSDLRMELTSPSGHTLFIGGASGGPLPPGGVDWNGIPFTGSIPASSGALQAINANYTYTNFGAVNGNWTVQFFNNYGFGTVDWTDVQIVLLAGETGACCLPGFTCTTTTAAGCAASGGTYQGNNSSCSTCPEPPPPPPGHTLPDTHTNMTGNEAWSTLFRVGSGLDRSHQVIWSASTLSEAGVTPGTEIIGVQYRAGLISSGSSWPASTATFSDYEIRIGQAATTPTTMSLTYAANFSGTPTLVHDGLLTISPNTFPGPTTFPGPGATPSAWGQPIMFSMPYTYTGGDLVIESRVTASLDAGSEIWLDGFTDDATGFGANGYRAMGNAGFGALTGDFTFSGVSMTRVLVAGGPQCYANCDESTTPPVLNVADFSCFLTEFAAGNSYANCDESTTPPVLNVADFSCFLTKFAAGCP